MWYIILRKVAYALLSAIADYKLDREGQVCKVRIEKQIQNGSKYSIDHITTFHNNRFRIAYKTIIAKSTVRPILEIWHCHWCNLDQVT